MKAYLKVDNLFNPLCITTLAPSFSFFFEGDEGNVVIENYQLKIIKILDGEVAYNSQKLAYLGSQNLKFGDLNLDYECMYEARLSVFCNVGTAVATARFGTPLRKFRARLVTPAREVNGLPIFYKSFTLPKREIAYARLYATALGVYEAHINGKRVGSDYLAPGSSDYSEYVYYQTYDITDLIKEGGNAISVYTGSGWYCGHIFFQRQFYGKKPLVAFEVAVYYKDGTREYANSSAGCFAYRQSPFLEADNLDGETFDKRLDRNFSFPNTPVEDLVECLIADDSNAKTVKTVLKKLQILPEMTAGVRICGELQVKEIVDDSVVDGQRRVILDFGQNFAGVAKFTLKGRAGSRIVMRYAEMLCTDKNGRTAIYTDNLRGAKATDVYIKATGGEEEYMPRFTFHGFRYAEVTGAEDCTGVGYPFFSHLEQAGSLSTGNPLVNRLISNIFWGQRSNFISIPTDCPQRDERAGWTGDAQVFCATALYNYDAKNFFQKYLKDMRTTQKYSEYGAYIDIAPATGETNMSGASPAWGDAGIIIPYRLYEVYRDTEVIEENYAAMQNWIKFLQTMAPTNILRGVHSYGDWLAIVRSPRAVTNTAFYANSVRLMAKMAAIIGKDEDAKAYDKLFGDIKKSFCKRFVRKNGRIRGNTQTVYALAVAFELVDGKAKDSAIKRLVENIKKRGNRISSGFIGVALVCPLLSEYGYSDVAYSLLLQEEYPSWLYSVKQGATTIWERWNSYTLKNGFENKGMNSFNHYSFGAIGEWMYRYMLGISSEDGYKTVTIRPHADPRLPHAEGSYQSPRGKISVCWSLSGGTLTLKTTLPPNLPATIHLPNTPPHQVIGGTHALTCDWQ